MANAWTKRLTMGISSTLRSAAFSPSPRSRRSSASPYAFTIASVGWSGSLRLRRLEPRLEHQHRPQPRVPVAPPRLVLEPAAQHGFRLEEALRTQARRIEQGFGPIAQLAAQPVADR